MSQRIDKEDQVLEVFQISNRAAKQIDPQVHDLAKANLKINVKKAEFIKEHAAKYKQQHGLPADYKLNMHDKGQIAQLHSWADYHKFKSSITGFAHYCKAEYGVKDLHDIKPEMAKSFLHELADLGYSKNSVSGYISQLEKFSAFTGNDFHAEIKDFKRSDDYKSLESKDVTTRAYDAPEKIIDALGGIGSKTETAEKAQFSATLQLNYGLRAGDACHFRCIGNNQIQYNSKNGMDTKKTLAPEHYSRAVALSDGGKYNFSVNTYKDNWSRACAAAGAENYGLHGLRHGFAQNTYNSLVARGLNHKEACLVVSHEMNHSRPGITEVYLR